MKKHQCLLVIEDDLSARRALAGGLTAAGHRVIVTGNGLDALAAAHGGSPDAVVLNVHPPIALCLETALALQRNCFTAQMRTVIRSTMPEEEVRAMFPVCDAYVGTESLDALVDAVASIAAQQSFHAELEPRNREAQFRC